MNVAVATTPPEPRPANRGVTDIADRVVEKIAGRAAGEVEHVHAPPAHGLGRITGAANDPEVDVDVTGSSVRVDVRVAVDYPAPIRTVAEQIQAAIRNRVRELVGLEVTAVQVHVAALSAQPSRPPRAA